MTFFILQSWGSEFGISYSNPVTIAIFIVYSVVMVGIGVYSAFFMESEDDYYAAGRNMGVVVITLSIFAALYSGWALIGVPGAAYNAGIEVVIVSAVANSVGMVSGYWLLARKMRVLGEVKDAITAPDAIYYRYSSEKLRLLTAASVFLGCIGYLASQYAALGVVGTIVLPVGFMEALIIGLAVLVFYTVVGGILAALYSDALQGSMIALSAVLVTWYVSAEYPGGITGAMTSISQAQPEFMDMTILGMNGILPAGAVLGLIMLGLTIPGLPHFITRFYMTKTVATIKWGALITILIYATVGVMFFGLGVVGRAAEIDGIIQVSNPDLIAPAVIIEFAPPLVVSFVLVTIIAAVMSTSNAFLNLAASSIVHDVLIEYMEKDLTGSQQVFWSRVATAVVAIGSVILAATSGSIIFALGAAGWAIFVSITVPGIVIGYNWKEATSEGVLWGGGSALLLTILFAYGEAYRLFTLPWGFSGYGGQLGGLVGIILFIIISLFTSSETYDDLDNDIQLVMDMPRISGLPQRYYERKSPQQGAESD